MHKIDQLSEKSCWASLKRQIFLCCESESDIKASRINHWFHRFSHAITRRKRCDSGGRCEGINIDHIAKGNSSYNWGQKQRVMI